MIISKINKYKGVTAFYILIIASVCLISARFNELNKKTETSNASVIAINEN